MGSGLMVVQENLEKLKSSDPAKAEALLKDCQSLNQSANNPEAVKAKAKEMMSKL